MRKTYAAPEFALFNREALYFFSCFFHNFWDNFDIDDILKDIFTHNFFDLLSEMVAFSLGHKCKYLTALLEIYNTIFMIKNEEPLRELYSNFQATFTMLFDQIHPDNKGKYNRMLINLITNVAYADKAIAGELIDHGYFNGLIELLVMDSASYLNVLHTLDIIIDVADEQHLAKLFGAFPDLPTTLLAISNNNQAFDVCNSIYEILLYFLKANDSDFRLVDSITTSEDYLRLEDMRKQSEKLKTINAES